MTRSRRVQELFDAAAAVDGPARADVLRRRAGGDPELVAEVEALLAADRQPAPRLDGTAAQLLRELEDEPAGTLCGETFGPYRIDAHLASGGMGEVYVATRTTVGIERRVAIKVLKQALAGAGLLARFAAERATLAALQHEHIVGFLDAGALPDGRPYLVMELVDGRPVTDWVAERGLDLPRRLELFLQVLAAVQCAHRALVVHRDLKPTNVLVTPEGTPKLLDFGIATVAAAEGSPAPGPVALTPAYASPEQMRGDRVGTASDVYSLGVLLDEVVRVDRGRSRVPADVVAIIAKATAREPAQRYASADGFAADIRRFLCRQPVVARSGDGWKYRVACALRRNRWPVVFGLALLGALAAGWIASDWRLRSAERDASTGWGAHAAARSAAGVLADVLAALVEGRAELEVLAVERLEAALGSERAQPPEAEFLLRRLAAELLQRRGELSRAARHAESALRLSERTRGLGSADQRRARELCERIAAARAAGDADDPVNAAPFSRGRTDRGSGPR
jgi:serine/threonine-protein kinase